jgi:lipopolysaccharide/colanic/teichoic acid biosynthesis glycosyltransferase
MLRSPMLRSLSDMSRPPTRRLGERGWPWPYLAAKRLFDLGFSAVVLLPSLVLVAACLLLLNPLFNPGPLFYRPRRMGRFCRPFRLYKFRTMEPADASRGPDDPVEVERVTPLGAILRRARFDELPQIINVFRGEMSLIGPRPDDLPHARVFLRHIAGYRQRYAVRPGISGLAQVELGYVHGREGAGRKTAIDLHYIRHAGLALDVWIVWRTLRIVVDLKGR